MALFNNDLESSRDLTTLTTSSSEFLHISASAADATVVHPKENKTLLGLITFFIKGSPVFSNGSKTLPRSPPDYTILGN